MRTLLLSAACLGILSVCALLGVRGQEGDAAVRLRLVDAATGKNVGGLVRIYEGDSKKPLTLAGLYDRLKGLKRTDEVAGWHVVPAAGAEVKLPRGRLRLEALSGLETALARETLDLTGKLPAEVAVKLPLLFRPEQEGLAAGNTHLHLRGLTPADCDEYLKQIPAADGIRVMFVSYLERFKDDASYITNRYPVGDLKQFDATGVLFNNGEEHRHNFTGFGQGYGHVMFLNIKELVKPVSLGPGITGSGNDDRPLRPGIEEARRQGGTVIWCHNTNGHEDVLSALAGKLDALNVFDGSRGGTFEDSYYRYLNIGLRMPISTGTDWFIYDFSRVYARVPGPLSVKGWLDAVKAGRCSATNGPLLRLTVDGKELGDVINLDQPRTVRLEASAVGRHDFQKLQLLQNGRVIHTEKAEGKGGGFTARLHREVRIDAPCWFAVRIESTTRNEFDAVLYAHSSPVYVDFQGKSVFDVEAARGLLKQVEEGVADIQAKGTFSNDKARDQLLRLYEEARKDLIARINQRSP
jgi:hypothetical protein